MVERLVLIFYISFTIRPLLLPKLKKHMKKFILMAATILTSQFASAQLSIAPEAGFQMSNLRTKSDSSISSPGTKAGFRAGINLGLGLTKKINLHVGAFYSQKGAQEDPLGVKIKENLSYIEIPVYVNYSVLKFAGNELFVGAGPYVSYCINARMKTSGSFWGMSLDDNIELPIGNDENIDAVKPLDFGANANIGFVTKLGIYARVHYALGLSNTIPGGDSDNSIKNTSFGLSVGYQVKL